MGMGQQKKHERRQEPFAIELYERFLNGESADRLASNLGIRIDRVEMRLRAAAAFLNPRDKKAA
jgi:hypothetical protein